MVRPICDLPPLSESLRDSESHLNAHSGGHAGPHGVWGYYIHVLFNRWAIEVCVVSYLNKLLNEEKITLCRQYLITLK